VLRGASSALFHKKEQREEKEKRGGEKEEDNTSLPNPSTMLLFLNATGKKGKKRVRQRSSPKFSQGK